MAVNVDREPVVALINSTYERTLLPLRAVRHVH